MMNNASVLNQARGKWFLLQPIINSLWYNVLEIIASFGLEGTLKISSPLWAGMPPKMSLFYNILTCGWMILVCEKF